MLEVWHSPGRDARPPLQIAHDALCVFYPDNLLKIPRFLFSFKSFIEDLYPYSVRRVVHAFHFSPPIPHGVRWQLFGSKVIDNNRARFQFRVVDFGHGSLPALNFLSMCISLNESYMENGTGQRDTQREGEAEADFHSLVGLDRFACVYTFEGGASNSRDLCDIF